MENQKDAVIFDIWFCNNSDHLFGEYILGLFQLYFLCLLTSSVHLDPDMLPENVWTVLLMSNKSCNENSFQLFSVFVASL